MDKEDFFDEARRIANFVANCNPDFQNKGNDCFFCGALWNWSLGKYFPHQENCIYIAALKLFDLYEEDDTDE